VEAEKIGNTPMKLTISPNADERKRLTKRMGLGGFAQPGIGPGNEPRFRQQRDFRFGPDPRGVTQNSVVSGKAIQKRYHR
jgi:hypothetical protein